VTAPTHVQVHAGPIFREHRPRRRNQPHAAQDASRPARIDGRSARHRSADRLSDEEPFFVLATQNPIEQEGTYPLPEAQLDRFLFRSRSIPDDAEEELIMRQGTSDTSTTVTKVLHGEDILRLQQIVRRVPVADHVSTSPSASPGYRAPAPRKAADFVNKWLTWGAGPRASMT